MEEARQHSPLKAEHAALFAAYAIGLLAVFIGLALQFTIGDQSLHVGLVVFLFSKVLIGVWQVLRPHALDWPQPSTRLTPIYTALWFAAAIVISLPLWEKV